MHRTNPTIVLGIVALLCMSLSAKAQWKLSPLAGQARTQGVPMVERVQEDSAQLTLPFWEDFTQAGALPDTSFWFDTNGPTVTRNTALNAPSRNVATLDGVDAQGSPYAQSGIDSAPTDSLVSRFIDLSGVPVSQRDELFISFFWQKEGLGDLPDADDFLELRAITADGTWVTLWSRSGADEAPDQLFSQEVIRLDSAAWFHPYFQFQFRAIGNPTGSFDTWHLDYIFLDAGDNADNPFHADWVINDFPSGLFAPYSSVPLRHIDEQVATYLAQPAATTFSLASSSDAKPVSFNSLIYNLRDTSLVEAVDLSNGRVPKLDGSDPETSHFGGEYRIMTSSLPDAALIQQEIDNLLDTADERSFPALQLRHEFHYVTGDGFRIDQIIDGGANPDDTLFATAVDYRVNDTVYRDTELHDYYAYDDGTAEFAAGINTAGGQVAVRFVLAQTDFIESVDIYFPIVGTAANRNIQLKLFANENGVPGRELAQGVEESLGQPGGLNVFTRFSFTNTVLVSDTIFVGYQQQGDDRIAIGFDKNTDHFDQVFINIDGTWIQDETLSGSLMIRPVFNFPFNITNRPEAPGLSSSYRVWPNPGKGTFTISGDWQVAEVYDMGGTQVPVQLDERGKISFNGQNGLYLVRVWTGRQWVSRRVLLQN